MDKEELEALDDLHLITLKKMMYVCNVDEAAINDENDYVKKVREYAKKDGSEVITICGKLKTIPRDSKLNIIRDLVQVLQ